MTATWPYQHRGLQDGGKAAAVVVARKNVGRMAVAAAVLSLPLVLVVIIASTFPPQLTHAA